MLHHLTITATGGLSELFRQRGISHFTQAADFVRQLPYRRNSNKDDLPAVLSDGYGTCSTKHAVLRQLAAENAWSGFRLMLCIFKMNGTNTPAVARTLNQYRLPYMPEAHNYLRVDDAIWDCTTVRSTAGNFIADLLVETEIEPAQISGFKVAFHKDFLEIWLSKNKAISYSPTELFAIREQCIKDLEHDC
jgi:hypothetical protein